VASRHRKGVGSGASRGSQASVVSSGGTSQAKMEDTYFRPKVLLPRGAAFSPARELSDPFAHFGTEWPRDRAEGYRELAPDATPKFGSLRTKNSSATLFASTDTCGTNSFAKRSSRHMHRVHYYVTL